MALLRCLAQECKNETLYTLEPEPKWLWVHEPPVKGDGRGAWIAFPETHMIEDGTTNVVAAELNSLMDET